MCFSATGSLALSAVLAGAGVAAISLNRSRTHRLFAAIPLIFAVQQAAEGVVWLTIADPARAAIQHLAVDIFLGIAVVFWPIWCPFALLVAEHNPVRRRILGGLSVLGVMMSAGALVLLVRWQPVAVVAGHSIRYIHEPDSLGILSLVIYTLVTVTPFFFSTTRLARTLGLTFLAALVVTFLVQRDTLTSVWCFCAAVLSGQILLAVWQGPHAAIKGLPLVADTNPGTP